MNPANPNPPRPKQKPASPRLVVPLQLALGLASAIFGVLAQAEDLLGQRFGFLAVAAVLALAVAAVVLPTRPSDGVDRRRRRRRLAALAGGVAAVFLGIGIGIGQWIVDPPPRSCKTTRPAQVAVPPVTRPPSTPAPQKRIQQVKLLSQRPIDLPGAPRAIAIDQTTAWVVTFEGELIGIDVKDPYGPITTSEAGSDPFDVATGMGAVWVAGQGRLRKLDAGDPDKEIWSRQLGCEDGEVEVGYGKVWFKDYPQGLVRIIDPETGDVETDVWLPEGHKAAAITLGFDYLWITTEDPENGVEYLLQVDQDGRIQRRIRVQRDPQDLAAQEDFVWIVHSLDHVVTRYSPTRSSVLTGRAKFKGDVAGGIAVDRSGAYVAASPNYLSRFDLATGKRTATTTVGNDPLDLAVAAGRIWVTNRESESISLLRPSP
jgi:streptogramin lyase